MTGRRGGASVTVLGLGAMGLPMALRLADVGFTVSAFDPAPERAALAQQGGIAVRASPGDSVSRADTVVLSVRDQAQAEQTLFGDGGAAAHLPPAACTVVTSTIGVDAMRDISARLGAAGSRVVDAPVSGGPTRARNGDLLVMAAGAVDDLRAVSPVLAALSGTLVTAGSRIGDGQLLKTVNQLLAGVHIAAAAEALALAARVGLEPGAVVEALSAGAGGSFMFSDRGPRMLQVLAGESPPVRSRVGIFVKDMGLVGALSERSDTATPVAAAAAELFGRAARRGLGDADDSALVGLLADRSDEVGA